MSGTARGAAAVVLALVGLLAGSRWPCSASEDLWPAFDLPELKTVSVDGRMEDWGGAGLRVNLLVPPDGAVRPYSNFNARCLLGWNQSGLLALLFVEDDCWTEADSGTRFSGGDSVELLLAPWKGAPDVCRWTIVPGMSVVGERPRQVLEDGRKTDVLQGLPAEVSAARTPIGAGVEGDPPLGYVMELLVPWSSVGILPSEGKEVAFQIGVNDADGVVGGAVCRNVWFPAPTEGAGSGALQRVRLAATASFPVLVRAVVVEQAWRPDGLAVRILGPRTYAGAPVSLVAGALKAGGGELGSDASGYAMADLRVPPPPRGRSYGALGVFVGGRQADLLVLPPFTLKSEE